MAATGGAPRRRNVTAVPDKPDLPRTTFSFDTAEREDGQSAPFVVELDKKRYVLGDVMNLTANDLLGALQNALSLMELVAPETDREVFVAAVRKQPAWKVRDVAASYFDHYGVPIGPEAGALPA